MEKKAQIKDVWSLFNLPFGKFNINPDLIHS